MIYYGWAGWGPYHDRYGSIWFLAGVIFWAVLRPVIASFVYRGEGKRRFHSINALFIVLWILMGAAVGGYYSWFASQKVALETCSHLKVHFD